MSDEQYPRGKARVDDEGATSIAMVARDGTIFIVFKAPMAWIGLGAEEARRLAAKLCELADGIEQ